MYIVNSPNLKKKRNLCHSICKKYTMYFFYNHEFNHNSKLHKYEYHYPNYFIRNLILENENYFSGHCIN